MNIDEFMDWLYNSVVSHKLLCGFYIACGFSVNNHRLAVGNYFLQHVASRSTDAAGTSRVAEVKDRKFSR